jgi:2-keto-4-pentenoate hydratase/2-oxohepta-3-ene-1,7-dioic acid hydratase in catechol pathway
MFSPRELELERGWPGRIEGDTVVQLAAQTLQAFFTGGGAAREHAEYAFEDVLLRAPVLHPPSIRIFDGDDFSFANPASVHGPDDSVHLPQGVDEIQPVLRLAAVIGASVIGGYTLMNDWQAPGLPGVKSTDFAISLGPVVLTPDELGRRLADLDELVERAVLNTRLLPGDVIAAPAVFRGDPVRAGGVGEVSRSPFGNLRNPVALTLPQG